MARQALAVFATTSAVQSPRGYPARRRNGRLEFFPEVARDYPQAGCVAMPPASIDRELGSSPQPISRSKRRRRRTSSPATDTKATKNPGGFQSEPARDDTDLPADGPFANNRSIRLRIDLRTIGNRCLVEKRAVRRHWTPSEASGSIEFNHRADPARRRLDPRIAAWESRIPKTRAHG